MATIRRASHQLGGIDPRSPITLTIPQHNLITSFQSISNSPIQRIQQSSPFSNSPNPFSFKNPTPQPSPISTPQRLFSFYEAFPTANPPRIQTFTQTQSQIASHITIAEPPPAPKKSSMKFLLQTGRVPTLFQSCPCGEGRQTTKHILKDCRHFSSQERQGLLSSPMDTGTPKTPRTPGSPRSPAEMKAMHAARKWRMKTLLGKYKEAVKKQEYGYGKIEEVNVKREQKSPRPDVVELGIVRNGWRTGRFA